MVNSALATDINGSRRTRRRNETKERLFRTALQLFAKKGYVNTPVEEITAAADVAKGTFFNYFPTKEHLLFALSERQQEVVRRAAAVAGTTTSVKPVIDQFVHDIATGPGGSPLMMRSLLGTAFLHEVMVKRFSEMLTFGRGELAKIMQRGQELGELRTDRTAEQLARGLQSVIFGTNALWALCGDKDLHELLNNALEVFWRGVEARPTNRKERR
jgi:AcrR family transcriptional regulator